MDELRAQARVLGWLAGKFTGVQLAEMAQEFHRAYPDDQAGLKLFAELVENAATSEADNPTNGR